MIALSELASKKLHFIGIGGAGMSGLARIALTHGAHVSGSDEKDSSVLAALSALGATVFSSHKSSQVTDADLVIYSNAISKSNPEIVHGNYICQCQKIFDHHTPPGSPDNQTILLDQFHCPG